MPAALPALALMANPGERRATLQVQGVGEKRGPAAEARALYTLLA